ncbi:MAG: hypothetical protein EOO41_03915 [Methanobacteriota archaeon]|nr:MAG: hypothetical protein EOO41_03915 [Euryarchaeota archaeon]
MTSDAVTQAPSIDVLPSLRDFVDDLRDAGELVAIPLLPAAAPVAVELAGGTSVEAPDCAARTGAAAPPTVASVAAGTAAANRTPEGKKGEGFDWSWFPLHLSSTDTQRLDRLKSRLQEIDEALGLAWPAVDENGRSLPPGSRPIQPPARVVAADASPASTAGASLA